LGTGDPRQCCRGRCGASCQLLEYRKRLLREGLTLSRDGRSSSKLLNPMARVIWGARCRWVCG
jgi:hypothetical protein